MKIKDTLPRCPKPAAAFPLSPSVVLRDHTKPRQPHTLDCRTLDRPIPHTLCTQHCPFWGVSSCPEKGNGATPGSSSRTPTCQGVWRHSHDGPLRTQVKGCTEHLSLGGAAPAQGAPPAPGTQPAPLYLMGFLGHSVICFRATGTQQETFKV